MQQRAVDHRILVAKPRESPTQCAPMPTPNAPHEDELIKGCIREEARAQEGLYRHFYGFGMSICLRYAGSQDEAKEIMNEGFFKVFTKIGQYDFSRSFRWWLRRILVNTAIDYYRAQKRFQHQVEVTEALCESPEADVVSRLSAEAIMSLLHKLPEHYRVTFNLFEIEGYSHAEIGKMLGIPAGTSRSNLTRAKKRLQELVYHHFNDQKQYA